MKKNVIKMAVAVVCVVAEGMGGMKAYNTTNQSEADMILAENVEALSMGDGSARYCIPAPGCCCYYGGYVLYGYMEVW